MRRSYKGSGNPNWKGGRKKASGGYVLVYAPDHPHAKDGIYVQEHRLVMEKELGRYLEPSEVVHHKNGKKDDNRLENLELLSSQSQHASLHGCPKRTPEGEQRIRAMLAKRNAERAWENEGPRFPALCHQCGKEFLSYYRNRAKYCSDRCKDDARNQRRRKPGDQG